MLMRIFNIRFSFGFLLGSIFRQSCGGSLAHGKSKLQMILDNSGLTLYSGISRHGKEEMSSRMGSREAEYTVEGVVRWV